MFTKQATVTTVTGVFIALLLLGYVGYLVWKPAAKEQDGSGTSMPASPQGFSSAQRHSFAVLRGTTKPLPRALQSEIQQGRNPAAKSLWLNSAKHVQAGDGIWVANSGKDTCIIQAHGGAMACEPREILFQRGVALGVAEVGRPADRDSREFAVYGIVPNQIRAIEVRIGNKKRRVPIRDNSYWLRASEPIMVKRFER